MTVTSKPGSAGKIHVYIDGEYKLTLYDDTWYRMGIKEGQQITDERLAALQEEAGFRSAYEKALRLLGVRAYSKKELTDKLCIKFSRENAERAVEKAAGYGYIDDEAYAREYALYLFEKKKYDVKRIRTELKIKGINAETADNILKTLDNEPIERIIVMLRSKYENGFPSPKEQKRFVSKLMRLGYSFGNIRAAFEECGFDINENRNFEL